RRRGSTTSVLHGREGVAYVNRVIQPAFFSRNDISTRIKRLSEKYGAPTREIRLPGGEDISRAVIVTWGSVQLEKLEPKYLAALASYQMSAYGLLLDHLGDVQRSLRLGLPVYRLQGGPGYVWSAAADRRGRGHLRFLALDGPALLGDRDVAASGPGGEA